MKYSVIVPVYNAESTIKKCIDSMLSQPHDDVEILLINDGSKDRSGEICEYFAAEYECIRYFSKKNGGVSSARNMGLDNASGEYVLFVDSDDYVEKNYFAVIDYEISSCAPQMLVWGHRVNMSDCVYSLGAHSAKTKADTAKIIAPALRNNLFSQLWCRSFVRRIIEENGIRFSEDLHIAEDLAFIVEYTCHISSIRTIEDALYIQMLSNQDSLSRKSRIDLAESLLKANKHMLGAVNQTVSEPEIHKTYNSSVTWLYYRSAYSASKELNKFKMCGREKRKRIRRICSLFCREHIKPRDLKCWVIALPIKLRMAFAIDRLINRKNKG